MVVALEPGIAQGLEHTIGQGRRPSAAAGENQNDKQVVAVVALLRLIEAVAGGRIVLGQWRILWKSAARTQCQRNGGGCKACNGSHAHRYVTFLANAITMGCNTVVSTTSTCRDAGL